MPTPTTNEHLFKEIAAAIERSRHYVKTAINTAMVYTYYNIGGYIVQYEQDGKAKAEYGKATLRELSERLTERFGKSWSADMLLRCRLLYQIYSRKIQAKTNFRYTVSEIGTTTTQPETEYSAPQLQPAMPLPEFVLSWNHYQVLIRIKDDAERSFYEIECHKQTKPSCRPS